MPPRRCIALHRHPLGCPCLCRETLKTSGTVGLIEGFRAGLTDSRAGETMSVCNFSETVSTWSKMQGYTERQTARE